MDESLIHVNKINDARAIVLSRVLLNILSVCAVRETRHCVEKSCTSKRIVNRLKPFWVLVPPGPPRVITSQKIFNVVWTLKKKGYRRRNREHVVYADSTLRKIGKRLYVASIKILGS